MKESLCVIAALTLALPLMGQRASPPVLDPVGGQTREDLVARARAQNGEILARPVRLNDVAFKTVFAAAH